jgi:hypothetical protein
VLARLHDKRATLRNLGILVPNGLLVQARLNPVLTNRCRFDAEIG